MIHHYLKNDLSGDHWGVNHNGLGAVLIQLQWRGEQVRVVMTPDQAVEFSAEITRISIIAREQKTHNEARDDDP